jgi:ABC-type branched-subunit amino acid transport system substrate-binding protein
MAADVAIEEINSQGGIKALGGGKLALREARANDSVEKAASAEQGVLTREKITVGHRLSVANIKGSRDGTRRGGLTLGPSSAVSLRPGYRGPQAGRLGG